MKSRFNKYLLSFFLMLICATVFAQKEPDLPGPPPNPGVIVPIDGGLSYLIISGIIYGVYELRRKKK